jgi:hypothetical protein
MHGQDNDLQLREVSFAAARGFQPVHIGHRDIDQGHIRVVSPDQADRLPARTGLADNLEIWLISQQRNQALTHKDVVISDDELNGFAQDPPPLSPMDNYNPCLLWNRSLDQGRMESSL